MSRLSLLLLFFIALSSSAAAQFTSIVQTEQLPMKSNTQDKTQSKVFAHDGKHWAVLPNSSGTHLWRIDGSKWTHILRLTTKTGSRADCKVVGNLVHVFMYQGTNSQLVSLEYVPSSSSYKLWSGNPSIVGISISSGVESAMIDVDGTGRMWLAYDGTNTVNVRWSDAPYTQWSSPITVASGINSNDKCAIVAMPGKIGVFWSNQNTGLFGFKTHIDGTSPTSWTNDETPASQSALNIGNGMSDDHFNLAVASDGTLYSAIKTGYNKSGYPLIGLLVRRTNGSWDDLYNVSDTGTTPTVILNEAQNKLKVLYTSQTYGKDIVYRESSTNNISFGNQHTLISGTSYRDQSSTKQNYTNDVFILASNTVSGVAIGVTASDGAATPPPSVPDTPTLNLPSSGATGIGVSPTLSWQATQGADSYQVQVATSAAFNSLVLNQTNLQATSLDVSNLAHGSTYYWRVRASNQAGDGQWSEAWSFTTEAPPVSQPQAPQLASPSNGASGIATSAALTWQAAQGTDSYQVQVATSTGFTNTLIDQSGVTATSLTASGLAHGSTYYWRVRASNQAGDGQWSEVWSFTTEAPPISAPGATVLTSPSSGATGIAVSPTLSWQAAQGADSYQVQVATSAAFNSLVLNQTNLQATSLDVSNLAFSSTYYWRVRASNQAGDGQWSTAWSFSTVEQPTSPPVSNLVGHWRMEEGSGNTLRDDSGNGNHATLRNTSGVSWTQGADGLGLSLPGTSNRYATVPSNSSLSITDAITIAAWIRPNARRDQTFVSKVYPNGYDLSMTSSGKALLWLNYESHGNQYRVESNGTLPTNGSTWVHVAATYDGRVANIYINGVEDKSVTFPSLMKIGTNNSNFAIGALGTVDRWNGGIDDLRIYNTVLGPSEIAALVNPAPLAQSQRRRLATTDLMDVVDPDANMTIYPNPFSSHAVLKFKVAEPGEYSVVLYDSKGALLSVLKQGIAKENELEEMTLDGSRLTRGLYFIRLQTKNGESKSAKLVVDK